MRDGYAQLQELGVEVYGVSFDTPEQNRAWAEKNAFPFRLLSDPTHEVAVAWGAAPDTSATYAKRVSYVLDEAGKVLLAYPRVRPDTHLDVVLADLKARTTNAGGKP